MTARITRSLLAPFGLALLALGALSCSSAKPDAKATPAPTKAPLAATAPVAAPAQEPAVVTPAAEASAETAAPAEAAPIGAEAQNLFNVRCSVCHGMSGHGDGPGSVALNPKPRSFSDATWQASVTDEHLTKVILDGGPSVGLSALMPPNPDLKAKPELVADLVRLVRQSKP